MVQGSGGREFCDAHFHPQDERLNSFREQWLQQARAEGVVRAVANGTGPDDWAKVAALCDSHPQLLAAYGLHPWKVAEVEDGWQEKLLGFLDTGPACCVGEFGFDRWIRNPDIGAQKAAFVFQWQAALDRGLPATIHCLEAWGILVEQLKECEPLPRGFLLHSYGGSPELIQELLPLGAWFSFSAYLLHPRKEKSRESFRRVPLDRLLLETDAPDMLPPKEFLYEAQEKPDLHHPASLVSFFDEAAKLRAMDSDEFRCIVNENFRRFFHIGRW